MMKTAFEQEGRLQRIQAPVVSAGCRRTKHNLVSVQTCDFMLPRRP
jgi:hypothetical protein